MNELVIKWDKIGLLNECWNEITRKLVAQKLEDAAQHIINTFKPPYTEEYDHFCGIVLPSVAKVYSTMGCSGNYPRADWFVDDCWKYFKANGKDVKKRDDEDDLAKKYCEDIMERLVMAYEI